MSVIDFSPAAAPAPATRRVLGHARTEFVLLVRNGEQLLLALVIPVALLVAGRVAGGRFGLLDTLVPSVLALALWSTSFTSVAIATGFERRYGVLERLAATPLGRGGLLAGKGLAVLLVVLGQVVVLVAVGLALGWRPAYAVASVAWSVLLGLVAVATFAAVALLMAGRLRAEITLAVANLVYVVFLVAGGLLLPLSRYPAAVRPVLELLPTAALGEGLRAAATGTVLAWTLPVLLVWMVVAALAARKGFRWTA